MNDSTVGLFKGCGISENGKNIILKFENGCIDLPIEEAAKILPTLHKVLSLKNKISDEKESHLVQVFQPKTANFSLSGKRPVLKIDNGLPSEANYILTDDIVWNIGSQIVDVIKFIKGEHKDDTH